MTGNQIEAPRRVFLFLQGPPGPFFEQLAAGLVELGARVHRINLSGGDQYDWHGEAFHYRGRRSKWPMVVDRYLRQHGITDLVLFGDCRPMHKAAIRMSRLRNVHIHVFEEGYIRPDWMTLEPDGVNGYSLLDRDPQRMLADARWLPKVPDLPPITADFNRRARDSYWHYHNVVTGRFLFRYPFYSSHRQGSIMLDGIGWSFRFLRRGQRKRAAERTLAAIKGKPFFLFPLQLNGDYQIRAHSPFGSMRVAAEYVLESFAAFAPASSILLIKEHPLDSSFINWRRVIAKHAKSLGIADRVMHIDGGDLKSLAQAAQGMVCVNSTSGTLALEHGLPVVVLGDAVYDIGGITHQAGLDGFWNSPEPPDPNLYEAFKRTLHAKCLVRGGLASKSAVTALVQSSIERILGGTDHSRLGDAKVPPDSRMPMPLVGGTRS